MFPPLGPGGGDIPPQLALRRHLHPRRPLGERELRAAGGGHLYQGTYKSFPVEHDPHLLAVNRYVERNALRAGLVRRAEDWRWCSLWRRERGGPGAAAVLAEWPVGRPGDWLARVNEPQTPAEEAAVRLSVRRGRPFGSEAWQAREAERLGLLASLRPRGRPRKAADSTRGGI